MARLDGSLAILDAESGRMLSTVIAPVPAGTNQLTDPVEGVRWDVRMVLPLPKSLCSQPPPWAVDLVQWGGERLLTKSSGWQADFTQASGTMDGEWIWPPRRKAPRAVTAWFTPVPSAVVVQTPGAVYPPRRCDRQGTATSCDGICRTRWRECQPSGNRAVVIDEWGRAELWGPQGRMAELGRLARPSDNVPPTAIFSRDGSFFCTTGDVGQARVFRGDTGETLVHVARACL